MIRVWRAGVVSALLLVVLAGGGCSAAPRCPAGASCPSVLPRLAYALTVNGHPVPAAREGDAPRIRIRPGQRLRIDVVVTLPGHVTVRTLWLGISAASYGFSHHRPAGLNPILAVSREPMSAGPHTFRLRWRFPRHHRGALLLVSAWSSSRPSGGVAQPIATVSRA